MMPSGGGRLEVANPNGLHLPGDVCPRCSSRQQPAGEPEEAIDDSPTLDEILSDPFLDTLIEAIYERMRERAEAKQ